MNSKPADFEKAKYEVWRTYENKEPKLIRKGLIREAFESNGVVIEHPLDENWENNPNFYQGGVVCVAQLPPTGPNLGELIMIGDYIRVHCDFFVRTGFKAFEIADNWPIPFIETGEFSTLYELNPGLSNLLGVSNIWLKTHDDNFIIPIPVIDFVQEFNDRNEEELPIVPGTYTYYAFLARMFNSQEEFLIGNFFGQQVKERYYGTS